jgi:N-ethylmaleimide reductase
MPQPAAPPTLPGALLPPAGDRAHPRTPAPAHVAPAAPGGARTRSVAARIHAYGGAEVLQVDEVPVPVPGAGQLLVAVGAAGVNGLDWKMREGYVRDVYPLTFPTALGLELAGEVAAVGAGVTRFRAGDRVMGLTRGPGAYADFVVVDEAQVARTPAALSDVEAAALPVAVLTAAQALDAAGGVRAGSTVLVHGAAGAVGGFAVQLAKAAGATVLATRRARAAATSSASAPTW